MTPHVGVGRPAPVLAYTDPPIRRRLELASDLRLDELHRVLQAAFEWEGGHLHQFSAESRTWDDGSAVDFGDSWEHAVVLEEIVEPAMRNSSPR